MLRENIQDILLLSVVARERSFTRAAAQLGMSQSGVSHAIKGLEERLQVRLLTRTTRSVSLTAEGERLLDAIGPRLEEIEIEIGAVADLSRKPAGTIRITSEDFAIDHVLWPKLRKVLKDYPDIKVEMVVDYGLTDIVAERFDAGVRIGEVLSDGMIAVRISADQRMIAIGSPDYFGTHPVPLTPQDLAHHDCINLRLPTRGGLYAWEFEKDGQALAIRVDGQMTFNGINQILRTAVDGYGIGFVPEGLAMPHISSGELVQVLADWCPYYTGYHLYYPSKRQPTAAFKVVLNALRAGL